MDRVAPTRRPPGRLQGFQRWDRLLFSHWEVPAEELRPRVHPRLSLDEFEGRTFVGLVAFTMKGVRPYRWLPPFPTARDFGEINLRTYVHLDGAEPGVWFFSLDAASSLVVRAARALWGLPYHRSDIAIHDRDPEVLFECQRRWPGPPAGEWRAELEIGGALPQPSPGSLEFFLSERYQFYAPASAGRLRRARVHHAPYELFSARTRVVGDALLQAAGIGALGRRTPDFWSPGVDVDVYPLETL